MGQGYLGKWNGLVFIRGCGMGACAIFSIFKKRAPAHLFNEIHTERNVSYSLRRQCEYQPAGRTTRFSSTYFQNVVFEWSLLDKI